VDDERAAEGHEEPGPPAPELDGLAMAAFVFSLVSLVVPVVMTAVAVVLARLADRRIAAAPGVRRGHQLATAARVVSLTWFAVVVAAGVWLVALLAMADDEDDARPFARLELSSESLGRAALQVPLDAYADRYPNPYADRYVVPEPEAAVFQGDAQPTAGPLWFEEDAVLSYSSTGSDLLITVVGDGEREVIARCTRPCDGQVSVGRFQESDSYLLEIDTDDAWYVRVEGGHETAD
jgi:hypothetical protein